MSHKKAQEAQTNSFHLDLCLLCLFVAGSLGLIRVHLWLIIFTPDSSVSGS